MTTQAGDIPWTQRYKIAMFLLILATIIGSGVYAHGDPIAGIYYKFGAALVPGAFGAALALPFTRGPRKPLYGATALTLAFAFIFAFNVEELLDTYDAKQVVGLLASASGPGDFMAKLDQNKSSNRMAAVAKVVVEAAQGTGSEMQALMVKLVPAELDAPLKAESTSLDDFRQLYQAAKTAESNAVVAEMQVDELFARERKRVLDYLRRSGLAAHNQEQVLKGLDERHADYKPYFKRLFALKAQQFRHTAQFFAILTKEYGKFERDPSGKWVFANQDAVSSFNAMSAAMQATGTALAAHLKQGESLDARYREKAKRLAEGK